MTLVGQEVSHLTVFLSSTVPPHRTFISNSAGLEVSGVIGPYALKSSATLSCTVEGGELIGALHFLCNKMNGRLDFPDLSHSGEFLEGSINLPSGITSRFLWPNFLG